MGWPDVLRQADMLAKGEQPAAGSFGQLALSYLQALNSGDAKAADRVAATHDLDAIAIALQFVALSDESTQDLKSKAEAAANRLNMRR